MDSNPATPDDIEAFIAHYIEACANQGYHHNLPKEDQDRMVYILASALDAIREDSNTNRDGA